MPTSLLVSSTSSIVSFNHWYRRRWASCVKWFLQQTVHFLIPRFYRNLFVNFHFKHFFVYFVIFFQTFLALLVRICACVTARCFLLVKITWSMTVCNVLSELVEAANFQKFCLHLNIKSSLVELYCRFIVIRVCHSYVLCNLWKSAARVKAKKDQRFAKYLVDVSCMAHAEAKSTNACFTCTITRACLIASVSCWHIRREGEWMAFTVFLA